MYTPVLLKNPFLLGKTKAVKSGTEDFIQSNRTLEGWPHVQVSTSQMDVEHQRSCPDFAQSRRLSNASSSPVAAVSESNETQEQ